MSDRRSKRWLTVALVLGGSTTFVWLAAIAMTWNGPLRGEDYLEDRRFFEAAQPICRAAQDDLADLPRAIDTPEAEERMAVITEGTDRLQQMVDDLESKVPEGEANQPIRVWLGHWGTHISDRRDFVDRVRKHGTEEKFLETTLVGTQISKSLNRFAETNAIPACVTPDDV